MEENKEMPDLEKLRHSAAHVLAQAVKELFPDTKLGIGPVIEDGFYYDFQKKEPFTNDDLIKLESKMKEISRQNLKIEMVELSDKEINELKKREPFKKELMEDLEKSKSKPTFYRQGNFIDLCRGPHVNYTSKVKAFKLMRVSGAYWKGDQKREQMQRVYGTCWPTKDELDAYLKRLEEAEKRDHRKLGKDLELFHISDDIGPGLVLWLPKGNIIKEELEGWAKETEKKWGYTRVTTPIITKEGLFYISEHLPHYHESMFSPMDIEGEKYYIKPMNCPFHHMIFKVRPRSYRELPLRLAEYGWCHRYEQSGAVVGLLRVRGMQMNDAHIYCTKEQAVEEFVKVIRLHEYYYKILGIADYWMELALRNPENNKYHGDDEMWKEAEGLMRRAMDISGVKYIVQNDGAAFYGPKIDFQIKSVTGRSFTASTNQIDLFMPKKFNLKYDGEDGKAHTPVVIHRAPLGTHERFIGFLIEHFAGKFPLWLSPVQVKLLTVTDRAVEFAEKIQSMLNDADVRVELDSRTETIPKKVRDAQLEHVPLMVTIGDKEVDNQTLAVRTLDGKVKFGIKPEDFVKLVKETIKEKSIEIKL